MSASHETRTVVRVLFLSDGSLLSSGIEALLREKTILHTAGSDSSMDQILDCIHAFRPDIIIHHPRESYGASAATWLHILKETAGIRLLELSLMHNTICIYHGKTQVLQKDTDLLLAIQQALE